MDKSRPLVIGFGSSVRCDDRIGPYLARRLKRHGDFRGRVRTLSGDGFQLLDRFGESDCVIIVDAVSSGDEPGTIYRIDARASELPKDWWSCSTHSLSVADAIEMARAMNTLPRQLIIYGIEGACFDIGTRMTPAVKAAADKAIAMILEELGCTSPL